MEQLSFDFEAVNESRLVSTASVVPETSLAAIQKQLDRVRQEIGMTLDIFCRSCEHGVSRHESELPQECLSCCVLNKLRGLGDKLLRLTHEERWIKRKMRGGI